LVYRGEAVVWSPNYVREIISDVTAKLNLLSKWKFVYPLAEDYDAFLDSCYPSKLRPFIQVVGMLLSHNNSIKHITYDLPCIPGLVDFFRLWNNYDLNGRLIYRATTISLIDDYVRSNAKVTFIGGDEYLLSFWSVSPYTAHYFVQRYVKRFYIDPRDIHVLVMQYDSNLCSKDWYDNFTPEYSVYSNGKLYNFGYIRYLRELEVRCYGVRTSSVKYALTYDEFSEVFKYLPKDFVYRE